MARHSLSRRTVVGAYVRKPRLGSGALSIVSRLVGERNAGKSPAFREPMPTRGTVTRHNGR